MRIQVLRTPWRMHSDMTIANDNTPPYQNHNWADETYAGEISNTRQHDTLIPSSSGGLIYTSAYSSVKSGVKIERPIHPDTAKRQSSAHPRHKSKTNKKPPSHIALLTLFLGWLIGAFLIARYSGGLSDRPLVGENLALASGVFGFLSLYLSRIARLRDAKFIHSLSITSTCLALGWCAWYYTGAYLSTLSVDYFCVGIAAGMLLIATLLRSPFFLNLSLLTALAWSVFSFITAEISPLAWLFPALWSLQMFKALGFKINRTVLLSLITGLVWIGAHAIMLNPFNLSI